MSQNQKRSMDELNRLSPEEFRKSEKNPVCIILDNVRSALNVGSAFRTADAFRVDSVVLCGITAKPPHKEIFKTALGATDTVKWRYFERVKDAIETLRNEGWGIVSVEQAHSSEALQDFERVLPQAFIFGNEVEGVSQEAINLSDSCVEIPQFGSKHSFNISVSLGIIVWEVLRKADRIG